MTLWGLAVTHLYETARSYGLRDVMETPRPNKIGNKPRLLHWLPITMSWLMYGLKVFFLGYKQYAYTRGFRSLIQSRQGGWPRTVVIAGGLMLFGVTASHHILRMAGLPVRQVYWGNMFARVLELPAKFVQTTAVMSLVQLALNLIPLSDQLHVVGPKGWGLG